MIYGLLLIAAGSICGAQAEHSTSWLRRLRMFIIEAACLFAGGWTLFVWIEAEWSEELKELPPWVWAVLGVLGLLALIASLREEPESRQPKRET